MNTEDNNNKLEAQKEVNNQDENNNNNNNNNNNEANCLQVYKDQLPISACMSESEYKVLDEICSESEYSEDVSSDYALSSDFHELKDINENENDLEDDSNEVLEDYKTDDTYKTEIENENNKIESDVEDEEIYDANHNTDSNNNEDNKEDDNNKLIVDEKLENILETTAVPIVFYLTLNDIMGPLPGSFSLDCLLESPINDPYKQKIRDDEKQCMFSTLTMIFPKNFTLFDIKERLGLSMTAMLKQTASKNRYLNSMLEIVPIISTDIINLSAVLSYSGCILAQLPIIDYTETIKDFMDRIQYQCMCSPILYFVVDISPKRSFYRNYSRRIGMNLLGRLLSPDVDEAINKMADEEMASCIKNENDKFKEEGISLETIKKEIKNALEINAKFKLIDEAKNLEKIVSSGMKSMVTEISPMRTIISDNPLLNNNEVDLDDKECYSKTITNSTSSAVIQKGLPLRIYNDFSNLLPNPEMFPEYKVSEVLDDMILPQEFYIKDSFLSMTNVFRTYFTNCDMYDRVRKTYDYKMAARAMYACETFYANKEGIIFTESLFSKKNIKNDVNWTYITSRKSVRRIYSFLTGNKIEAPTTIIINNKTQRSYDKGTKISNIEKIFLKLKMKSMYRSEMSGNKPIKLPSILWEPIYDQQMTMITGSPTSMFMLRTVNVPSPNTFIDDNTLITSNLKNNNNNNNENNEEPYNNEKITLQDIQNIASKTAQNEFENRPFDTKKYYEIWMRKFKNSTILRENFSPMKKFSPKIKRDLESITVFRLPNRLISPLTLFMIFALIALYIIIFRTRTFMFNQFLNEYVLFCLKNPDGIVKFDHSMPAFLSNKAIMQDMFDTLLNRIDEVKEKIWWNDEDKSYYLDLFLNYSDYLNKDVYKTLCGRGSKTFIDPRLNIFRIGCPIYGYVDDKYTHQVFESLGTRDFKRQVWDRIPLFNRTRKMVIDDNSHLMEIGYVKFSTKWDLLFLLVIFYLIWTVVRYIHIIKRFSTAGYLPSPKNVAKNEKLIAKIKILKEQVAVQDPVYSKEPTRHTFYDSSLVKRYLMNTTLNPLAKNNNSAIPLYQLLYILQKTNEKRQNEETNEKFRINIFKSRDDHTGIEVKFFIKNLKNVILKERGYATITAMEKSKKVHKKLMITKLMERKTVTVVGTMLKEVGFLILSVFTDNRKIAQVIEADHVKRKGDSPNFEIYKDVNWIF